MRYELFWNVPLAARVDGGPRQFSQQFLDVVKQENDNLEVSEAAFREVCDVRRLNGKSARNAHATKQQAKRKREGHLLPGASGWYSRIVYLGDEVSSSLNGRPVPVFSFTSPQSFAKEQGPPSPSYARTIGRGLKQTYDHLTDKDIALYLSTREGPHGRVNAAEVESWLAAHV